MQFSIIFKQLCKEKGVTQQKALSDLELNRNATQRWRDGMPAPETLQKIAKYFDTSVDALLGDENKKTPTPKGERDYLRLVEAFENADESTREAILLLLRLK